MKDEVTSAPRPWLLADDLVLAQVEQRVLGIAQPVTIGRYRIQRPLGEGGMGRLLLAFDPDLQRQVALKLVAPQRASSSEARRRIVAEARAMARLSDPHVAQVYEVDEIDGQLFLAIEYVDGMSLLAWLTAERRSWRAIVGVFVQAGAGLAAAHEAGIVHRDFKPENVMLDLQGRARVVDFGLAGDDPIVRERANEGFGAGLTRTGAMLGTPAYMAPEQWEGGRVDAKSDQFAFCVALFEALAGARPFAGANDDELRSSLRGTPVVSWPRGTPRYLLRALERGLAHEPAARWPDLRALLRAIDPVRRTQRALAFGVTAIVVGLSATAIAAARDPCGDSAAPIDRTWNPTRQHELRAAATRTEPHWGERSGDRVAVQLDEVADAWRGAARAVCLAGGNAASRACLEHTRARIDDLVAQVLRGEPPLLVSAVARAELLPIPSACVDAPDLSAWRDPPDDREVVEALGAAERHLGALTVPGEPSEYRDASAHARATAAAAIASAEAIGHEPWLGRALLVAGRIELGEGDHVRAESLLRRGLAMSRRAGDSPTSAAIAADLVYAMSRDNDRIREAEDLASEAAGMIEALGRPPLLHARLLAHRASALARSKGEQHGDAVSLHEEVATELRATLGDEHPATIVEQGNIGAALGAASRHEEAERLLAEALAAGERVWGDEHPRTAALLGSLGLARMRLGEFAAAESDLRRSLALREVALGTDHPQVDDARYNLALLLRRRGAHAEAVALLRDGLAHVRSRRGDDDPLLGAWWVAEGESLLELGKPEDARAALDAALRLFERSGAGARDYARVRFGAARAWQDSDPGRARLLAEQARADALEAHADVLLTEIDAWLATPLR